MKLYYPPSLANDYDPKNMVFSTWVDHMAFGYDLVEAVKPEILVELGSHNGFSFFVFSQSIKENKLNTTAYAVDTWQGDTQTGAYDDEVFQSVQKHLRDEYRGFTYQMRMLFNEALDHFSDESIDLLHIDGLHTYDAVSEDFTNWYPKMKPGGIIIFHDIKARRDDFGVWKFWEETTAKHETFTFNHGFGLGVLRKPGGEPNTHPLIEMLFNSNEEEQWKLRQFYIDMGIFIQLKRWEKRGRIRPVPGEEKIKTS